MDYGQNEPIVGVGVAAPAVGDAVADDGEAARGGRQRRFDGADEVPARISYVSWYAVGAYQWSTLITDGSVRFFAPTQFPKDTQEVVLLPGWPVIKLPCCPWAR